VVFSEKSQKSPGKWRQMALSRGSKAPFRRARSRRRWIANRQSARPYICAVRLHQAASGARIRQLSAISYEKEGQAFQTTDREPIDPATDGFVRRVWSRVRYRSVRPRELRRPRPGEPESSRGFRLLLTNPQPFRTTFVSQKLSHPTRAAVGLLRKNASSRGCVRFGGRVSLRRSTARAPFSRAHLDPVELPADWRDLLVRSRMTASRADVVSAQPFSAAAIWYRSSPGAER
jgi:hypothetical protein